jgi:hypothetical protein
MNVEPQLATSWEVFEEAFFYVKLKSDCYENKNISIDMGYLAR